MYFFFTIAKFKSTPNATFSNVMTRMSSSTPSLPDASNDSSSTNVSVASTDQASSADNLAAKVWCLAHNKLYFILLLNNMYYYSKLLNN